MPQKTSLVVFVFCWSNVFPLFNNNKIYAPPLPPNRWTHVRICYQTRQLTSTLPRQMPLGILGNFNRKASRTCRRTVPHFSLADHRITIENLIGADLTQRATLFSISFKTSRPIGIGIERCTNVSPKRVVRIQTLNIIDVQRRIGLPIDLFPYPI